MKPRSGTAPTLKVSVSRLPEGLAEGVSVFPQLAHSALKAGYAIQFAGWAILRAADSAEGGSSHLPRPRAIEWLATGRAVSEGQARRNLHAGAGLFWELKGDRVNLRSGAKVAQALGVEWVGLPHLIPAEDFQRGAAHLRAALQATVYRPDEEGHPMSRRLVTELTGVSKSSQRRHEHGRGHAQLVTDVPVKITHIEPPAQEEYARRQRHLGFYLGRNGQLMHRGASIRSAHRHELGSRSAERRLNRRLAKLNGTPANPRGRGSESFVRSYFPAPQGGKGGADSYLHTKLALGKPAVRKLVLVPALDFSTIEIKRGGRSYWESAASPGGEVTP